MKRLLLVVVLVFAGVAVSAQTLDSGTPTPEGVGLVLAPYGGVDSDMSAVLPEGSSLEECTTCPSCASFAPALDPDVLTITTTLDGTPPTPNPAYSTETGAQTGRLNRFSPASTCGSIKPNPGLNTPVNSRQYDEYRFVALSSGCVTVTLRNAGNNLLFSAAYNEGGLVPSNPSLNYLADAGSSPTTTIPSKSFSFDVTDGQIFHVVIHEVDPAGGVGQSYTLDVEGVKLVPDLSVNGTLDAVPPPPSPAYISATGNQTGRLNRFSPASTCAAPKTNPGLFTATGSRRADAYRFIPAGTGCALVSLTHTGSGQAQVVAYDEGGFNAADPSVNYLADAGSSASNNTRVFSFLVENGVPFDIVISEVEPGTGIGDVYVLNISNVELIAKIKIRSTLDTIPPPSGAEYTSSRGLQTGRLTRNGVESTCETPKPNPGIFTLSGTRLYDAYTFSPPGTGCVQVTLRPSGSTPNLFNVAYNSSGFNPGDPSANYLADPGTSGTNASPRTFSFAAVAGTPFSVVVHELNPGGGNGQGYELEVGGIIFWQSALPFFEDGFESGNTAGWTLTVP